MQSSRYVAFVLALWPLISLTASPVAALPQSGAAVLNDAGFPVKGITRRETTLYTQPDKGSQGRLFEQFKFVYVLPPEKGDPRRLRDLGSLTKNGFYRVARGDSDGELLGWLPEEDVEQWHHIQALGFTDNTARKPANFFETEVDAQKFFEDEDKDLPLYQEPETSGGQLILMPLLEARQITVDSAEQNLYEVSFLAGPVESTSMPGAPGGPGTPTTKEELLKNLSLDLVFVIDTTASMTDPIREVRESIMKVSRILDDQPDLPTLRLGLVGYRDTITDQSAMKYLTKVFCNLDEGEDLNYFLRQMERMDVSDVGSDDWPEDVWAGVNEALDKQGMQWNQGSGWQIITIVGDASAHPLGHPKNSTKSSPKSILAKAQPGLLVESGGNPVHFIVQHIIHEDDRVKSDQDVARRQFAELTIDSALGGDYLKSSVGEDFSDQLAQSILDLLGILGKITKAPKGTPVPAASTKTSVRPVYILKKLRELEEQEAVSGLNFSKAVASEFNPDGDRLFNEYVFVSKGRLRAFSALMDFFQISLEQAGTPGARNVEDVVNNMRSLSVTLHLGEDIQADTSLDTLIRATLGFPVKTDIFDLGVRQLAEMSQADWDGWVTEMREVVRTLETLLDNPSIWWALDDGAKQDNYHAFIKLSDLP